MISESPMSDMMSSVKSIVLITMKVESNRRRNRDHDDAALRHACRKSMHHEHRQNDAFDSDLPDAVERLLACSRPARRFR